MNKPLSQHNTEIALNARVWEQKPILRKVYARFYEHIAEALETTTGEGILEIGSGIGAIKTVLPKCTTSDIFPNEWLDRQENAYTLNYPDGSLKGIVLFDVWHHLRYPGVALKEFERVLTPNGKVVLFEPAMGLLGRLIYGVFHHEPLALRAPITWAPAKDETASLDYYAAQGNCWRIFFRQEYNINEHSSLLFSELRLLSALTYTAAGGFSKPQLYPNFLYSILLSLERLLDKQPRLFATRMLVTLSKQLR